MHIKRIVVRLCSIVLAIIAGYGAYAECAADVFPFQNPNLPLQIRVDDLISRMTLPEKISELGSNAPGIERLGLKAYNYWNEALHGVMAAGMTSFPQAIALSSTWDRELIYQVASAISDEARVKNNLDGKGLTYWSPVINMARDPRWGRTEETYGEDPFLTTQIALNFIRGMQGTDPKYLKTVATIKHFACNNVDVNRESISSQVDERSLREYYLPAFKTCVTKSGVYSVMSTYNALNDVPGPVNRTLLTYILRDEWGFNGFTVSDCDAVANTHTTHGYVQFAQEATSLAIKSGTDLNCGDYYQLFTDSAISTGILSIAEIDTALVRVFKARFLLGEFDPPDLVPYTSLPDSEIDCQEHRDLALLAAKKAIVLLKNQNAILPLNKDSIFNIAVIGPNAGKVQLGAYSGYPNVLISPLQGIIDKFAGPGKTVNYALGCTFSGPKDSASFHDAVNLAEKSDVAIVVCGTDLEVVSEGRDRTSLDLPGVQDSLIMEVLRVNPRTIVVLVSGFPLSINRINDRVPGVISSWYNGQAQGAAIADVLFGDYNPGGKLTSTWYCSVSDIPAMDHYNVRENRTYQYFTGTPIYPFGYGLSYTTFDYGNMVVNKSSLNPDDSLKVTCTITNTGRTAGEEVAQFYVHHVSPSVKRPLKELRDFQRISLQPGESKAVTFMLHHEDLTFYDDISKSYLVENGQVDLMIGSSSDDIKLNGQVVAYGKMLASVYKQNALAQFEAEHFENKSKRLTLIECSEGGQSIQNNAENDFVVFKNVDFGTGVKQFDARIELDPEVGQEGVLEIRLDSMTGPVAGSMALIANPTENGYQTKSCTMSGATGIHDVFIIFRKSGSAFCKTGSGFKRR
ncbi:MAG: glycoside hydrolase family 3 C-terminal domain-containing protein [Bacteroidetes bacterium]|nr:glycoside hydrolase family 3 C-terminal domain-containing protein [Bacteroidota bacterium]